MKNLKKLALIALCLALVFCLTMALAACQDPDEHKCESVCETCHKCTNKDCKEDACADKCKGHDSDPHQCESICPEPDCGKCLNPNCQEEACLEKCPGNHGSQGYNISEHYVGKYNGSRGNFTYHLEIEAEAVYLQINDGDLLPGEITDYSYNSGIKFKLNSVNYTILPPVSIEETPFGLVTLEFDSYSVGCMRETQQGEINPGAPDALTNVPEVFFGTWKTENEDHVLFVDQHNFKLDNYYATEFEANSIMSVTLYSAVIGGKTYSFMAPTKGRLSLHDVDANTDIDLLLEGYVDEPETPELKEGIYGTFKGEKDSVTYVLKVEEADNANKGTISLKIGDADAVTAEILSYTFNGNHNYNIKVGQTTYRLEAHLGSDKELLWYDLYLGEGVTNYVRMTLDNSQGGGDEPGPGGAVENPEVTLDSKYHGTFYTRIDGSLYKFEVAEHKITVTIDGVVAATTLTSISGSGTNAEIAFNINSASYSLGPNSNNVNFYYLTTPTANNIKVYREVSVVVDDLAGLEGKATVSIEVTNSNVENAGVYLYNDTIKVTIVLENGFEVESVLINSTDKTSNVNSDGFFTQQLSTKTAYDYVIFIMLQSTGGAGGDTPAGPVENPDVSIDDKFLGEFIAVVSGADYRLIVSEHSIAITFGEDVKTVYLLSFTASGNSGSAEIQYDGNDYTVTFSTVNKYYLRNSDRSTDITFNRIMTVELVFESSQGNVTISAPANGIAYIYNEEITITITTEDGYAIDAVTYSNSSSSYNPTDKGNGTYTRKLTLAGGVITVTFKAASAE